MTQLLRLAVLSALFALVQAQKTVSQHSTSSFALLLVTDILTGITRRVMEQGSSPATLQRSTSQSSESYFMVSPEHFTGFVSSFSISIEFDVTADRSATLIDWKRNQNNRYMLTLTIGMTCTKRKLPLSSRRFPLGLTNVYFAQVWLLDSSYVSFIEGPWILSAFTQS